MRLTVLSPHRDDAVFSLAHALGAWSRAGAEITVLNFFTRSAYAPFATDGADVSSLRAREDRRSLGLVSGDIRIRSLGLLDAPLRLGIEFGAITDPAAFTPRAEEVQAFGRYIRKLARKSLVLAPLALGDHIDHRTVHCASIVGAAGQDIGFYEDLPYASWTAEQVIQNRIAIAEGELQYPLAPAFRRSQRRQCKARAVAQYRSQIDDAMVKTIARYSEKYRGAERIWFPRHSRRWHPLLST